LKDKEWNFKNETVVKQYTYTIMYGLFYECKFLTIEETNKNKTKQKKTIYVHNKYDRCKIEPAVAMAIFW